MIKILVLLLLCVIFYFLFNKYENYQNLDEFYKLNELIDTGDESSKFTFTIEKIEVEPVTNEFLDESIISDSNENILLNQEISNNIDKSQLQSQSQSQSQSQLQLQLKSQSQSVNQPQTTLALSDTSNEYLISFTNSSLILKQNNNIITESQNYKISLNNPGYYNFECPNNFMVNKELTISIESDNIIIDGNYLVINLSTILNTKGVFKNGTSNNNGKNNVVIRNMHFIYKQDNSQGGNFNMGQNQQMQNPASLNGGGGVCMDYFGNGSQNNVISNCFVYKSSFVRNSGGIVGKYAGQNGELIVMNCVLNGNDMDYVFGSTATGMRNTGGICGPYLGYNGGKVLIYNCSNYASFMNQGCSGIIGSNAANKNSHVVLFCCSNFGSMSMKDNCSGLVGPNSCKESSNLSIVCCYCLEGDYISYSETYAPFVGYSSVLDKSNLNIVMCYNTLKVDSQDEVSKLFVATADGLSQSVSGSDGSSSEHTQEQQSQHQRDSDSKIFIDYCFNSNISSNISDAEIEEKEFGSNLSNVTLTNCGKINLTVNGNNSNTLFSNRLANYTINFDGIDNNQFPYNNLFSSHVDKDVYLYDNFERLFTSVGGNTVNLKQYFDDNLLNENCLYSSMSSNFTIYYRLKNNIIYTSCANDSSPLEPNDYQYNTTFSRNSDYNLCKNKSINDCDIDRCVFKTFYNSIRCFPKNNNTGSNYGNPVGLGKQSVNCLNLNNFECQNNQDCMIGPGNVCIPNNI